VLLDGKIDMQSVGERIAQSQSLAGFEQQPMPKRLSLLVEKLNEMHYQSRWEAGAEGPRVIFGRCPYAKVIAGHPELCKMDTAMLAISLGRPVIPLQKNEASLHGLCPLLFKVG
jgi:predicted ArsR family transcriptional regulator